MLSHLLRRFIGTPMCTATLLGWAGGLRMSHSRPVPGRLLRFSGVVLALAATTAVASAEASDRAIATLHTGSGSIGNHVVQLQWTSSAQSVQHVVFADLLHHTTVPLAAPFAVQLRDGRVYRLDSMRLESPPKEHALPAAPEAPRAAERVPGEQVDVPLVSNDGAVHATWSVVLRDGSRYLRQLLTLSAGSQDLPITRVTMLDVSVPEAHVVGSVAGSPIVAGDLYFGLEHPLSHSAVTAGRSTAWMERDLPLRAGQSIQYSSVIGVTRAGQLRRDFLAYVERERAHPYRTFLHYNSWYDLGYFTPYDQALAIDRVNAFGHELHDKRGVVLSSYLFDDGWDDHHSLWKFNSGFPNGFTPVREAAAKYGAAPGVWMSPWGGYSTPKQERIAYGKSQGFEIVSDGYALSGPKYFDRFREVCMEMIQKYGINQFKFDGTGNANSVFPGSAFDSDFGAAIHLIGDLRKARPDIFINLTTGTRPSPFWLAYADSIWRGGEDDDFAGVGTYRQRWITYRDGDTYQRIVKGGPLFPLNSLMLHGMIYARFHKHLNADPGDDFRNEIRSYFGTGTQLQEMYITPSLLSTANWDDLAEAANWSRSNADVLKDTHWVGGDPLALAVYGWASWSPRKGILVLRNPSDKPQQISLDLASVFELPEGAPRSYTAHSPWKDDRNTASLPLVAGTPHTFQLAPFQVLTLDMEPQRRTR